MRIQVISRADCPACVRAKTWLDRNGIAYEETQIGRDITREEVLRRHPGVRLVPIIVLNGQTLKDLDDLKERARLITGKTFSEGEFNGN